MSIQTINIGAVADDGTGDPLRTAFGKTNDNFSNLTVNINTVQANVTTLTTSVNTIKANVDSVASNVNTIQANVTNILTSTTSFAGNIGIGNTAPASKLVVQGSLVSNGTSLVELNPTWNSSANTFTALKMNVVNTASSSSSLLMDLQVDGASKFKIDKAGKSVATNFEQTIGGSGFYTNGIFSTANYFSAYAINAGGGGIVSTAAILTRNAPFVLTDASQASPVYLYRDAGDTIAQRNGNTAQTYRIYNNYTDASNNEFGKLAWSSNTFEIGTEALGTGTRRQIKLNYTTTIDGFARTNVPALTVSNVGAGNGGMALGVLNIGYAQDQTRVTAFDVANKALSYGVRGSAVAGQGAHRFTGDNTIGTSAGANGSIVDILAPSTATNIFQARQANETVVFNVGYDGSTTISGNLKLTGGINANSSVGTAGQVLTSNGTVAYWATPSSTYGAYGAFQSTSNQTCNASTATAMLFEQTDFAGGVTMTANSYIGLPNPGTYNLQFSVQTKNTGSAEDTLYIWLRQNNVDIVGSTGKVLVRGTQSGGSGEGITGWNFFIRSTAAAENVQIMWFAADETHTSLAAFPAQSATGSTPAIPSTASTVLTVNQIG